MAKKLIDFVKIFFTDPRWEKVRAVFWFCLITVVIHFSWRFWAIQLNYFPVKGFMVAISGFLTDQVYDQSLWVVKNILRMNIEAYANVMLCDNGAGISVVESCSGVKQIMQFALLMLVFPGPWKHKLWYIPMGMIIVHFTNILRISILVVVAKHSPTNIEYVHDTYVRIMFYVVIFILWLIWVEKISGKKAEKKDG